MPCYLCTQPVQVEGQPGAFDVKLEDGQTVYSRGGSGGGSLPEYSHLFTLLRQAGVQATA